MLMEYRDEEIEKMLENLTEVPVPAELSRRITERIDKTVRRRARTKVMRRSIGAVAAGVLLFSGSIMLLPSFAAYAKQIPGLEAAVRWLEGAGDFIGIRNAKEHGYIPAPSYRMMWGEREVSVDNLYLEDDRLFVTITIKGADIAEAKRSGRLGNQLEDYVATLPELDKEHFWDGSTSTTTYPVDTREEMSKRGQQSDDVVTWTYDKPLSPEFVEQLKQSSQQLTVRLTKVRRNEEYKVIDSESEDIQVPLGIENIKPTRVVNLEQAGTVDGPTVQQFLLKDMTISPTRMILDVRTRIAGGGKANLHPGEDWDNVVRENLILRDETGKVYPIRQSGNLREMVNGISRSRWEFVPSVYFENKPKQMTLELQRFYVTDAKATSAFRVRPDEKFPKKVQYEGKDITILGAEYDGKGVLHLKVQPDEAGNSPWRSAFLTYEPYYLKLQETDLNETWKQNGLNLNTPDARAIPLTGSQLADQYEDVPGMTFSPELGIMFDNVNRWEQSPEKPKEYDIAIMAPELDEYEISIRRYNAPVEVNQKIEFTIPPLAEEHERVGSLTEPKYSKTVNDLDGSILERAKQSIREAAGRDIELYGVEEYKGTAFHDVIVYSKDHKSRVALDVANGTSDISLSMSYAELPANIKHIVESDTGLSGQQLADLVTEVARERGRHEREVHTSITGPDFRVEMVGSRITSMGYEIPIDQADPKALEAAKEAGLVTLGKPVPIVQASRSYAADMRGGSSSDVYRFKDEQQDFLVEIGYTSGRFLSVYASGLLETGTNETEDMFSKFSDKQVFDAAAPDVKKLFGIDLAGYKVQRTTGTNDYRFTKEGSPAIEGEMNRHLKFYRFDITRNNGTIQ